MKSVTNLQLQLMCMGIYSAINVDKIIRHAAKVAQLEEQQMSRASRQKGQRGEREICKILAEKLGGEFKRNLMQTAEGGYDVLGLDGWAIEVKFQETLSIEKWWKQTVEQSSHTKKPVLFFRKSRTDWRVVVQHDLEYSMKNISGDMSVSNLYYSVIPMEEFIRIVK